MPKTSNQGWQPNGELPPSIKGMVMFARQLQTPMLAQDFVTQLALCAYKSGFDDATFEAQMNQMMNERGTDADH